MPQLTRSLLRWWASSSQTSAVAAPAATSDDELLQAVLAEPPDTERRGAIRHLCGLITDCRLISLVARPTLAAVIRDISTTGIGLVLEKPLPLGTFLAVEISAGRGRRPLRAQVVALRRQAEGDWLVGCLLLRPLSAEQVDELVS